jgi:hypothetical protein
MNLPAADIDDELLAVRLLGVKLYSHLPLFITIHISVFNITKFVYKVKKTIKKYVFSLLPLICRVLWHRGCRWG